MAWKWIMVGLLARLCFDAVGVGAQPRLSSLSIEIGGQHLEPQLLKFPAFPTTDLFGLALEFAREHELDQGEGCQHHGHADGRFLCVAAVLCENMAATIVRTHLQAMQRAVESSNTDEVAASCKDAFQLDLEH